MRATVTKADESFKGDMYHLEIHKGNKVRTTIIIWPQGEPKLGKLVGQTPQRWNQQVLAYI